MNTYHLQLLEQSLTEVLERYCVLCDFSPERDYLSGSTVLSETEVLIRQYLRLFQILGFLESGAVYYREGQVFEYQQE